MVTVEAGDLHTCVLLADGDVRCWGANAFGQVGDGTTLGRSAPAAVVTPGASQITADGSHSCALTEGRALCWGFNSDGQLGTGAPSGTSPNPAPLEVVGL